METSSKINYNLRVGIDLYGNCGSSYGDLYQRTCIDEQILGVCSVEHI